MAVDEYNVSLQIDPSQHRCDRCGEALLKVGDDFTRFGATQQRVRESHGLNLGRRPTNIVRAKAQVTTSRSTLKIFPDSPWNVWRFPPVIV
jgi:hypothetical protein